MKEWSIWDQIAVYRLYNFDEVKFLGERVLENDKYTGRIIHSVLEDSRTPNCGAFIVVHGYYISIYHNGIDIQRNAIVDLKKNLPEIYYGPFIKKIVQLYDRFDHKEENKAKGLLDEISKPIEDEPTERFMSEAEWTGIPRRYDE